MPTQQRCVSLAPSPEAAAVCCTQNESVIHVGLLAQLAKIKQGDEVFAPLAVRDTVRRVGLQPPMNAGFGDEKQYGLEMKLGKRSGSGMKVDVFGTAAMGMWQIPSQFDCMMRALHEDLGSSPRPLRSVCIGTWSGWTDLITAAYLQKLSPGARHTTFDVHDHVSPCLKTLHQSLGVTQVHNGWYGGKESWRPLGRYGDPNAAEPKPKPSRASRPRPGRALGERPGPSESDCPSPPCWDGEYPAKWPEPVLDFCLIDGGHSFYLANRDFRTLRTACRVVAFHDVVNSQVGWDAVPRLWKSLTDPRHAMYAHEFTSRNCTMQPTGGSGHYMGIGVLTRRSTGAAVSAVAGSVRLLKTD
jgi:hypothetical protein